MIWIYEQTFNLTGNFEEEFLWQLVQELGET